MNVFFKICATSFFLSVITFSFFRGAAFAACTCEPGNSFESVLDKSTAIFVGRVEEITSSPLKPGKFGIKFTVIKDFKGLDDFPLKTILVYAEKEKDKCGIDFSKGADYLIFASGSPAFFQTDTCMLTDFFETSKVNIEKLNRKFPQNEAKTTTSN